MSASSMKCVVSTIQQPWRHTSYTTQAMHPVSLVYWWEKTTPTTAELITLHSERLTRERADTDSTHGQTLHFDSFSSLPLHYTIPVPALPANDTKVNRAVETRCRLLVFCCSVCGWEPQPFRSELRVLFETINYYCGCSKALIVSLLVIDKVGETWKPWHCMDVYMYVTIYTRTSIRG